MENTSNEKQLYVQKEPFEYNGKTYNHYYIKVNNKAIKRYTPKVVYDKQTEYYSKNNNS